MSRIEERDAYWTTKERALEQHVLGDEPAYHDIELPRNSATGFVCAFLATFLGFAMIWHIWWLAILSFAGAFVTFVVFAWRDRAEYFIPAAEVARIAHETGALCVASFDHWGLPAAFITPEGVTLNGCASTVS